MDISFDSTTLITTVTTAVLAWAFKLARSFILSKIRSSDNAVYAQYMGIISDTAFDVVSAIMQTTVNAYKQQHGGIMSPEFAQNVKQGAIQSIKQQLANNIIEFLEGSTGDNIEHIIDTQVEKAVIGYKVAINNSRPGL